MPAQALPALCPFKTDAQLLIFGRWAAGGVAALTHQGRSVQFSVSPVLFDLLGIFILRAKDQEGSPDWVPTGFLTAEDLGRELTRRGGGDPDQPWYTDPQTVTRGVYRLRLLIAESLGQERSVEKWVDRFVENHPKLGYRLSTSPRNLELVILP